MSTDDSPRHPDPAVAALIELSGRVVDSHKDLTTALTEQRTASEASHKAAALALARIEADIKDERKVRADFRPKVERLVGHLDRLDKSEAAAAAKVRAAAADGEASIIEARSREIRERAEAKAAWWGRAKSLAPWLLGPALLWGAQRLGLPVPPPVQEADDGTPAAH